MMSQHAIICMPFRRCFRASHACKNCRLVSECSALYQEVAEQVPKGDATLAFSAVSIAPILYRGHCGAQHGCSVIKAVVQDIRGHRCRISRHVSCLLMPEYILKHIAQFVLPGVILLMQQHCIAMLQIKPLQGQSSTLRMLLTLPL